MFRPHHRLVMPRCTVQHGAAFATAPVRTKGENMMVAQPLSAKDRLVALLVELPDAALAEVVS